MKLILEFNLPEDTEEYEMAMNGSKHKYQLDNIWTNVFRPRHKHGYQDEKINELIDSKNGRKIMDYLEELYRETTSE